MEDFIFTPLVLMVGFGLHQAVLRLHTSSELRLLNLAFLAHVVSAIVQVLLVKYYFTGGGDMLGYFQNGVEVADVLRDDFVRFAPEVGKAFFQREDPELPVPLFGGGSTLSMSAVSTFLLFLLGNSLYAATTALAIASYLSMVLLYRALKPEFAAELQPTLLLGTNLLPSAVFWSSALLKEPLVMAALGPIVFGLKLISERRRHVLAIGLIAPSAILVAAIKPYVLMALSIAAAVFYLWKRFRSDSSAAMKPFALITAVALGGGGLMLGNKYFSKSENDSAANAMANQRSAGYAAEGGSNFQLEEVKEADEAQRRGLLQELLLAPLALGTALFRPFIFEARNAVQFVNALEATALLFIFWRAMRNASWRWLIATITASPALMFCTVFTLALALGTGLSTTNMGTLSRYRAPMMPLFFSLILIIDRSARKPVNRTTLSPTAAGQ